MDNLSEDNSSEHTWWVQLYTPLTILPNISLHPIVIVSITIQPIVTNPCDWAAVYSIILTVSISWSSVCPLCYNRKISDNTILLSDYQERNCIDYTLVTMSYAWLRWGAMSKVSLTNLSPSKSDISICLKLTHFHFTTKLV